MKLRLKKEPNGFHLNGTRTCMVCHQSIGTNENWYSKWGLTCLLCFRALENGVVPAFICKNDHSCYQTWELKDNFGIHPQTARKMVRTGELKARIVTTEDGKPYVYIFLKKENPQLVDPDRDSPGMKSWKRNRDKVLDRQIREAKRKELDSHRERNMIK